MAENLSDVAIQQQIDISRYLVLIPFTILVYEYISTFQLEVSRYWGTQLTWGTVFFYLNRYSALVGTIPILAELLLTTTDPKKAGMCAGFQGYHEYFALLSQIVVAVMLIMRTYALYERNKYILALTTSVTLAAIVFAVVMLLTGNARDTLDPRLKALGCPSPTSHDLNTRIAAAWGGMVRILKLNSTFHDSDLFQPNVQLVFDVMIFLLTIYKALRYETRSGSLLSVMFRDGAMYFGIMIGTNAANIATYTLGGPIISGSGTTVVNALSSVMLTRLMLNLRNPKVLRRTRRTTRLTTVDDSPAITTLMYPYLETDIAMESMAAGHLEEDGGRG
ncbi:hypothetical protein MSAN_01733400 [Mycena sanguinolenta]|uniref:DUF6533 domain-containing protein n=1 Tax=Mycena sanguinolenta TaxID=230812 RepID=A0A8H7CTA0_9AGAR|nr:hypothetical protein MSAN_01733400 [Mycena sanguinolenta]